VPPLTSARPLAFAAAVGAGCAATVLALGACGQILGVSSWVDVGPSTDGAAGDGKASGETGTTADGGADGAAAASCNSPVDGGLVGVLIQGVGGTPSYCIDSTETTMQLYEQFLSDPTVNPPQNQPPECAWNTAYGFEYMPYYGDPQALQKPVTAVHWCDAWGFCAYWGKHLCGNRVDGGAVDPTGPLAESQWYYACAGSANNAYPYGATYDAALCRTGLSFDAGPGVVPTTTCIGGVAGLYDMSGNLAEWENACIPSDGGDPADDACLIRGGTYFFPSSADTCGATTGGALNPRNGGAGGSSAVTIRCCWEP
jgi:sulfatase modifying factor 1